MSPVDADRQSRNNFLKPSLFHKLSNVLWVFIVGFIVLLAIYVSVGRMLASLSSNYQQAILQELNHRLPFLVEARRVSAEWHSFTPVLVLEDLRLTLPTAPNHPLELAGGRVGLDVAGSLRARTLKTSLLQLRGLSLAGQLTPDGQLRIRGFEAGDQDLADWAEEFLRTVDQVSLDKLRLALSLPSGEQRQFELDLALLRDGSRRWLQAQLVSSRGLRVQAAGEGVGNPFDPAAFAGQMYLDVGATEVGTLLELGRDHLPALKLSGALGLQAWLAWERGEPSLETRFELNELLLAAADDSWALPLDRLAFAASAQQRQQRWGLSIADLELTRGEAQLLVPRVQLDARGATLRLRAAGLPLAPLSALAGDTEALPAAAREVIRTLSASGRLSSVQLDITDINTPLDDWTLRGDFDQLAVQPWHGAPGVAGASGYLSLAPGGGLVVLDSRQFSMNFPTVYRQPLAYEDFYGTIHINWDEEAVRLSSGLVQAAAAEGPVRVLFGLSVPLVENPNGVEMDLLVGLEGSRPVHRGKYIPYILDAGLLGWLERSIGAGEIVQGGFLWRGSLLPDAAQLHTVQLFFNIEDTALDYHPDWPALAAVDGTVLIDDSNVSVWAASARLLDSRVRDLGVEVWQDPAGQLLLAVRGHISGPAEDGLAAINDSPLGAAAGGAFSRWEVTGELDTDLSLLLNLSDSTDPPGVDLTARLDAVDLEIMPGKLPLRGISGELAYRSPAGFFATGLSGQLWGRALRAAIDQCPVPAADAEAGSGGGPATCIDLSSSVAMDDIRSWLGQDWLAFGRGAAAVEAQLLVAPDSPLRLSLQSSLAGVSLDLPDPWAKAAAGQRQLQLDMSISREGSELAVALEGGMAARLALAGTESANGALQAASIAFGRQPDALAAGEFRFGGQLQQVDVAQWRSFYDSYLNPQAAAGGAAQAPLSLQLAIPDLRVEQLQWRGSELGAVAVQLAAQDGRRRASLQADWLRGEWLSPAAAGERTSLHISHLDLDWLESLELDPSEREDILEVPAMAVRVEGLQRDGQPLGGLAFDLRSDGANLHADAITGELAGLQLLPEEPGRFSWRQGADSRSSIEASAHFGNLAGTLEKFGYQNVIETDSGRFDVALAWPGAPQDFALEAASGSVRVDIREGHFPEVSAGASGTLRVVSILNLAEIVQQLSLSHMFESGIPFNTIEGEAVLQGGTIEVRDMAVQGGASSFQFSGVSEVASQSLDGELVVTLPVANNLPWVAALTAGLPVAAGVFVLSKLFESQVNRLTSLVYTTTGSWDEPVVKFDRVFDDSAAGDAASPSIQAADP